MLDCLKVVNIKHFSILQGKNEDVDVPWHISCEMQTTRR